VFKLTDERDHPQEEDERERKRRVRVSLGLERIRGLDGKEETRRAGDCGTGYLGLARVD
jgi:hypothetical protein